MNARRYRLALRARDEQLLQVTMDVVRASHAGLLLHHDLAPRLIARGAYRSPVPPSALAPLLRSDLRFVVTDHSHVSLTVRVIMQAEREQKDCFGSYPEERPQGDWLTAHDDAERRAWGEYLFDRGMEFRWAGRDHLAEAHYRATLMADAGHADAWVHVGNIRFDEGLPAEALRNYLNAESRPHLHRPDYDDDHNQYWADIRHDGQGTFQRDDSRTSYSVLDTGRYRGESGGGKGAHNCRMRREGVSRPEHVPAHVALRFLDRSANHHVQQYFTTWAVIVFMRRGRVRPRSASSPLM